MRLALVALALALAPGCGSDDTTMPTLMEMSATPPPRDMTRPPDLPCSDLDGGLFRICYSEDSPGCCAPCPFTPPSSPVPCPGVGLDCRYDRSEWLCEADGLLHCVSGACDHDAGP